MVAAGYCIDCGFANSIYSGNIYGLSVIERQRNRPRNTVLELIYTVNSFYRSDYLSRISVL